MVRSESPPDNLRELVAEVAAAYFGRSPVDSAEIAAVIAQIADSLGAIGSPRVGPATDPMERSPLFETEAGMADEREPALMPRPQVRRSITPDALISFEDGKPYRTLRLHLASRGLTPEAYREKWGLPADYPMIAPNYSALRSEMAKSLGLGRRKPSADTGEPRQDSGRRRKGQPPHSR
jgi:predicted transcriptional regulator